MYYFIFSLIFLFSKTFNGNQFWTFILHFSIRIKCFSLYVISCLWQNIYQDKYRYYYSFVVFIMSSCYNDCVCIQINSVINIHVSTGIYASGIPVIQEIYIVHVENTRFYVRMFYCLKINWYWFIFQANFWMEKINACPVLTS